VTELSENWLAHLGENTGIWLADELDRFPDLRDAIAPPRFRAALEPESSLVDTGDGHLELALTGSLVPPGESPDSPPNRLGAIELFIDTHVGHMQLNVLDVPPHLQQQGLGRLVVGQLAVLGDRLGLERIDVQAGNTGRWAWIRCGFDFEDADQRERVVLAATSFGRRLGLDLDLTDIEHSWDFLALEGTVTPEQIRAAGGAEVRPADEPVPLAKALILGPSASENLWFGQLTLDRKSEGRVRLDSYVLGNEAADASP
jgi:hypothetical protein